MEIEKTLENIGLSEKETKIYLALLELGAATVEALAKKTEIKRPTAYHIVGSLEEKGLVSEGPRSKKSLYIAASPEKIVSNLTQKAELVKRYLPQLMAMHNAQPDKPQVQMYSGREGIRQIYQEIMDAGEASFFSSVTRISKLYPELLEEFIKRVEENKIKFRDLFEQTQEDVDFTRSIKKVSNYEARLIPKGMKLPSDTGIYKDKLVFFSFQPTLTAIVVKNKEIAESLRTIYDLAWSKAKLVDDVE